MADISNVFVRQYEAEVHTAYQQGGSRLRNSVRVKTGVVGESTTFPIIGKGRVTQKARSADVTPMDVDHDKVTCPIADWYAPEYVDKLDEYKVKHDERRALSQAGAYAVGRKVDELIITAATSAALPANTIGTGTALLTLDNCLEAFALLNESEVPDDGQRYAVVGPRQWNALLKIDQFAKSNYVDNGYPWLKGREAKRWLNIIWMMHTGLSRLVNGNPAGEGDTPTGTACLMYHKSALGLAENGNGITAEINYVPQKVAHLINNMIACGAVAIDPLGIIVIKTKDK